MFKSVIELTDIIDYVGDFKRPFVEGSQIVKCNHIIEYACLENTDDRLKFVALCLKTSDLNGKPHQLEVIKSMLNKEVQLLGKCSCKAGTGKCKHIVGFMLKLQKTSEDDLAMLSCTDLPQKWGKLSFAASKDIHKPVPIKEFCHVKNVLASSVYEQSLPNELSEEMNTDIQSFFLQGFPNSAYAVHRFGRHEPIDDEIVPKNLDLNELFMLEKFITSKNSIISNSLESPFCINYCQVVKTYYLTNVVINKEQAIDICNKTLNQSGPIWKKMRQCRITGTSAYNFFTYAKGKNSDWGSKVKSVMFSTFTGNSATKYGLDNEKNALSCFELDFDVKVIRLGFIVNINCPWFGFSPDGFVKCGIHNYWLLEVKCPVEGKQLCGSDLIATLKYIRVNNGELSLKSKHKYYAQIQLGLLLCNLKNAYLIIYSTFDNSIITIQVQFDITFCQEFYNVLTSIYFNEIVHRLIKKD